LLQIYLPALKLLEGILSTGRAPHRLSRLEHDGVKNQGDEKARGGRSREEGGYDEKGVEKPDDE